MYRQQPASPESWRCCVGTQRRDAQRNLAPWNSCGNIPWMRQLSTSCQSKNGSRLVLSPASHGFLLHSFLNSNFCSGLREPELHPPLLMLLPLQKFYLKTFLFKDIGSNDNQDALQPLTFFLEHVPNDLVNSRKK